MITLLLIQTGNNSSVQQNKPAFILMLLMVILIIVIFVSGTLIIYMLARFHYRYNNPFKKKSDSLLNGKSVADPWAESGKRVSAPDTDNVDYPERGFGVDQEDENKTDEEFLN